MNINDLKGAPSEKIEPREDDPLEIIDPIELQGKLVPERRWLVQNYVPLHQVTMLSGDGATGKTLLALQLMVAAALSKSWLGMHVTPCKSFGVFCEDDKDEVHRRLADICRHYEADLGDLENMQYVCRAGEDNALMIFDHTSRPGETTGFYDQVVKHADDFGAQFIVADSLHDVFAGDENRRIQARQFVGGLRNIAVKTDGAVLLTAHPSLSGRSTGTGEAGSTAWNNAVRSRLYLIRDKEKASERILKTMKANYSPDGNQEKMTWVDGAYVSARKSGIEAAAEKQGCERVFLTLLGERQEQGRSTSESKNAGNYGPAAFARQPNNEGYSKADFTAAMESMFAKGSIKVGEYIGANRHKHKGIIAAGKATNDE